MEEITNYFKKDYSTQSYRDFVNKAGTPMVQYHKSLEVSNNINSSSINLDEQTENRFGNRYSSMGSSYGNNNYGKKVINYVLNVKNMVILPKIAQTKIVVLKEVKEKEEIIMVIT